VFVNILLLRNTILVHVPRWMLILKFLTSKCIHLDSGAKQVWHEASGAEDGVFKEDCI
jgi:hypothetical protein